MTQKPDDSEQPVREITLTGGQESIPEQEQADGFIDVCMVPRSGRMRVWIIVRDAEVLPAEEGSAVGIIVDAVDAATIGHLIATTAHHAEAINHMLAGGFERVKDLIDASGLLEAAE